MTPSRTLSAAAALAVALAAAACSSDSPKSTPAAAKTTSTAAPATPSPSPSPSPTSTARRLGTTVVVAPGVADATALAYQQPAAPKAPKPQQDGYEWAALDARICNLAPPSDDIEVSNKPWLLLYPDGTRAEPATDTYPTLFPAPAYPATSTVAGGHCVRGWIVFAAPAGKRPVEVQYRSTSSTLTVLWAVPTQ